MAWAIIKGRSQGKFSDVNVFHRLHVSQHLTRTISDVKYIHTPPRIAMDFDSIRRAVEVFPKVWLTILCKGAIVNGRLVTTIVGIRVVFVTIHVPFMLLNK